MKELTLESLCGRNFNDVAKDAKEMASKENAIVKFDFNGIECKVGSNTDLDLLWTYYADSHMMDWKSIGYDLKEYDEKTKKLIEQANIKRELKAERERKEYQQKVDIERKEYEAKVQGVEIELKDPEGWKKSVENNSDPYGKCAIDYARSWAKLMQVEMSNGKSLVDCAERTSHELGFYGITGFMYGAAVNVLSHAWVHGEELRKWHNKDYGHEGDGVVNPAILTIKD